MRGVGSQGMTCAAGLMLGPCGPRLTALLGVALATLGNSIVASQKPGGGAGAWVFLVGLGLVGGGGNALWLASFPLAQVCMGVRECRCRARAAALGQSAVVMAPCLSSHAPFSPCALCLVLAHTLF